MSLHIKMLAEYIWISIRCISVQPDTAKELDPQEISRILKDYEKFHVTSRISPNRLKDCHTLLGLVDFIEVYKRKDYVKAVSVSKISVIFLQYIKNVTRFLTFFCKAYSTT